MRYSLLLVVLGVVMAAGHLRGQDVLITYGSSDDLDRIDRATGNTLQTTNMTLAGFQVTGTAGLALHPTTSVIYVVIRDAAAAQHLCAVNRTTGVCTDRGVFTDIVASIAFDDTGTLYAVTADTAATPETLYTVNLTTAAMTLFMALGNGDTGECIAFNPVNGLMYHISGFTAPITFETINLQTQALTPVGTVPPTDVYSAFFYDGVANTFAAGTLGARYGNITTSGGFSQLNGVMALAIRGIIITQPVVPTVITSTQNLNLGNTITGTPSAPVSFTVEGLHLTAALTVTSFTGVEISLAQAAGYGPTISLPGAGGAVATTTIYARIPGSVAPGAVAGNIVVTSTGANTINVAANGQVNAPLVPEINLMRGANAVADGGTDAMGTQAAGTQHSVQYTIQNLGTLVLNLTGMPRVQVTAGANLTSASVVTQPGATVGAGASTTFNVNYNITTTGAFSFTVSIANDDANENPYNWTVSGTGQGAPEIEVTRAPATIGDGGTEALGNRAIGTIITLNYEIDNLGTDVLSVTPPLTLAGITGCNVTVTQQPGTTLAMGASTAFALSLIPTALGAFSVEISFVNNDADENPFNWTISGTGFGVAEISVASGGTGILDAGTDAVGAGHPAGVAITRTYDISNVGTAPLSITVPVTIVGPNNCTVTVVTQPSATVAPSATTQLTLSVTPSAAGAFNYGVSFVNGDANESPYNFTANGTATPGGGGGSGGSDSGSGGCAAGAGVAMPSALLLGILARRRRGMAK